MRRLGPQPPQLERLDVRRIRERLFQLKPAADAAISPYLGGVQRTLALTRDWFRFTTVEAATIDELPIWKVEGRWCGECLAALLPSHKEAAMKPGGITAAELPDGMAWSVRLSIGKRDLFPFRIEWLAIPGRRPVANGEPEPVAVLLGANTKIKTAAERALDCYVNNGSPSRAVLNELNILVPAVHSALVKVEAANKAGNSALTAAALAAFNEALAAYESYATQQGVTH